MPLKYIKTVDGSEIELSNEDCFGFAEAIITCPDDIKTCLLPRKIDGKTVHTKGVCPPLKGRGWYISQRN